MKLSRRGLFQALLGAPIAAAAAPVVAKTIYQIDLGRGTAMEVTREMRDAAEVLDFVREYDHYRTVIDSFYALPRGPIAQKDFRIPFTASSAAKY